MRQFFVLTFILRATLAKIVSDRNFYPRKGIEDRDINDVNKNLNLPHGDIMLDPRKMQNSVNQRSTINGDFYRWKLPIPIVLSSKASVFNFNQYVPSPNFADIFSKMIKHA